MTDLSILIGGPQGGGIESAGRVLIFTLSKCGYEIYSAREYFSNIKGRHSYFTIRLSEAIKRSAKYPVEILGCLDAETLFTHFKDVSSDGVLIVDDYVEKEKLEKISSMEPELKRKLLKTLKGSSGADILKVLKNKGNEIRKLSFIDILKKLGEKTGLKASVLARNLNIIVATAILHSMSIDLSTIKWGIERTFVEREKAASIAKLCAELTYEMLEKSYRPKFILKKKEKSNRILVSGNDIVAIGKVVAGLRFQTYYPITPASDESLLIERKEILKLKNGENDAILVVQTEDEIAAINMAIGAALTGTRAATSTSGPGFSLMVEGLGWAGMNETPVVITYYQRGGPSTGLPTRHSQSDLLFVIHSGHGEFPRIVIASGDHEEAFHDAIKSFEYAEKYQLPVIHLLDKALANSITSLSISEVPKIKRMLKTGNGERFKITKDGVSPFIPLGNGIIWYTGDEHNEIGRISEYPENRILMYEKRMKKLELAEKEIPPEDKFKYKENGSQTLILTWGSAKGAVLDALEVLDEKLDLLYLRIFSPFPREIKTILKKYDQLIAVEGNLEGQMATLIKQHTGIEVQKRILKYTGRPFFENEIIDGIKKLLHERERNEVILDYGA